MLEPRAVLAALIFGDFHYVMTDDGAGAVITDYTGTATSLAIPAVMDDLTVVSIDVWAFLDSTSLTSVSIPASVTKIGGSAFEGCTNLASITVSPLNAAYSDIDGVLFNRSQTTLVSCPEGRTGGYAVPEGVTNIAFGAFEKCVGVTSISLPSSLTSIGAYAFRRCGITSMSLPAGITSIDVGVFDECLALTSVSLPAGLTSIGDWAFSGCTALESLSLPASVATIGPDALFYCRGITEFVVDPVNTTFQAIDGVLFNKAGTELIAYPAGREGGYTVPVTVTSIGYAAFRHSYGLTSVSLPAGLTSIGDSAFSSIKALTTLSFPAGLETIGYRAFFGNWGLTSLEFPAGLKTVGYGAFTSCIGLVRVTFPAGVTTIEGKVFSDCIALKKISFLGGPPAEPESDLWSGGFSNKPPTVYYPPAYTSWPATFGGLATQPTNEAPTAVMLSRSSFSIAENTIVGTAIRMAEITITDDGVGTNTTTLSGPDAALFSINSGMLDLNAGAALDFEARKYLSVTVIVADTSVVGSRPVSATFTVTVTDVNEEPESLQLSHASIAEGNGVGAVVGQLSATDPDVGDTPTYAVASSNGWFFIDGNQLKAGVVLDFESRNSYWVVVQASDGRGGAVEKEFTITVTDVNEIPEALVLSNASIAEGNAVGAVVGTLSATDPDAGDSLIYTLVSSDGPFAIDGNQLRATATLDFESRGGFQIRVKATDAGGLAVESQFTISVMDVIEDTVGPVLIAVSAPAAGTYPAGGRLLMTATFNEPVVVFGLPTISFTGIRGGSAGAAARQATYESGAGTTRIVFSYEVAAGELATKGLVVATPIKLPAGALIADLAGNAPALSFNPPPTGGVRVDGTAPVLSKVGGPVAKTHRAGEVLSFSVSWNRNVTVTGIPRIPITVGREAREAVYVGGSGSKTLKFNYIATAGDNGGVALASGTIALAGGGIRDAIGNAAGLGLKAVKLVNVAVDTTPPAVVAVVLPATGSYSKGKTITIGVTFSEVVKMTGKPMLTVTFDAGVTRTFVYSKVTRGTALFTFTFVATETVSAFGLPGAITLAGTAAIRDSVGNAAVLSLPVAV